MRRSVEVHQAIYFQSNLDSSVVEGDSMATAPL